MPSSKAAKRLIEIVTVDPALAEKWLAKNHRNRPLRPAVVNEYAHTMTQGEWRLTPEPIAFCDAYTDPETKKEWGETLMEGQHRLSAVIKSGVSCDFTVSWHCDPEEFMVIGQAKPRTNADILAIVRGESLPYAKVCAGVCNAFIRRGLSHNMPVDSWMVRRLLARAEPDIIKVAEYKRSLKGIADANVVSALLLAQLADPEKTVSLVNQIRGGVGLKGDRDPARLLRGYLFDRKFTIQRDTPDVHFYRVCNGVAHKLNEGTVAALRIDPWGLQWLREAAKKRLDPIVKDIFGRTPASLYQPVLSERLKLLAKEEAGRS